jgi:hypothetical protein
VVIDGERSLGTEKGGHVSVVSLRDCLAVEGLLDKFANITVGLTAESIVLSQFTNSGSIGSLRESSGTIGGELGVGSLLVNIIVTFEDGVGV